MLKFLLALLETVKAFFFYQAGQNKVKADELDETKRVLDAANNARHSVPIDTDNDPFNRDNHV
jgi:hypothetical protein